MGSRIIKRTQCMVLRGSCNGGSSSCSYIQLQEHPGFGTPSVLASAHTERSENGFSMHEFPCIDMLLRRGTQRDCIEDLLQPTRRLFFLCRHGNKVPPQICDGPDPRDAAPGLAHGAQVGLFVPGGVLRY